MLKKWIGNNKKIFTIIIILSSILSLLPTKVFAWLPYSTYEACNKINIFTSIILMILAGIVFITYIISAILYTRQSKQENLLKRKNLLKWLIIVIIQILILLLGAFGVRKVGMEWYWHPSGERYQFNEIDVYISNGIRLFALILIVVYIINSIIYFRKSKKETDEKLIILAKWQMITITIVAILLMFATNW